MVSVFAVITYYCALMALALYYMVASCQGILPWSYCWDEWGDACFDNSAGNRRAANGSQSSADLYFRYINFPGTMELERERERTREYFSDISIYLYVSCSAPWYHMGGIALMHACSAWRHMFYLSKKLKKREKINLLFLELLLCSRTRSGIRIYYISRRATRGEITILYVTNCIADVISRTYIYPFRSLSLTRALNYHAPPITCAFFLLLPPIFRLIYVCTYTTRNFKFARFSNLRI